MPRVSVILNCYNHEPYVAEAVESVLAQTFTDFELILIDNGSTDGTRGVLDRFDDPRIRRFYHERNESLSRRLNQGVAAATGEYVAILYSDDMMLSDKLERQGAMFDALPEDYGVVYCPAIGLNQFTGERWEHRSMAVSGDLSQAIFDRHYDGPVDMSSPLVRTICFRQNPWHEDLFGDGEAVFFRIAAEWKFHFDPRPTVMLRDHDSNWGKSLKANGDMHLTIIDRLAADPRLTPAARAALERHRARYGVNTSWAYVRSNGEDTRWVWRKLLTAARISPRVLATPRFAAAALLSALPARFRKRANAAGNRVRKTAGNRRLIEG